ncbi:BCCT family transporter [Desulfosarcina sp.]|uniref:BCCT family transporter n=1 Tax=Desulfosarcina sp. TaxID=2027861 RepID=UPI00356A84BE
MAQNELDRSKNQNGMMEGLLGKTDHQLFWVTLIIFGVIVSLGIFTPEKLESALKALQAFITTNFTWYYLLFTAACLGFSLWAAVGPYAHIKLGKDDDEPEFSTISWMAMLFSAGIGLGFIFWGIAEPLYHYMQTPYGAEPGSAEAVPVALQISYLHWGFHPWSLYAVGGLGIAYFSFRHEQPMTIATSLYGILGEKTETSGWSKITNLVTAFATIAGISTALGLGILSIKFGMTHITGLEMTPGVTIAVLILFMAAYIASSVSGLKRGLKYMSLINIWLAFGVIAFIFVAGPTIQLLDLFTDSVGHYLTNFVKMTFWSDSVNQAFDGKWLGWWTVFYWAFWIAWVPFVGGFIARISRGRTIREFIIWVVLIPSVVMFICFDIFGGAAILAERSGAVKLWEAVQADMGSGIFTLLTVYPFGFLASIVIFISLIIFLITSADSASFLVAMLMSKGELEPKAGMKIVWGIVLGALSIILLQSGGLKALQTASIVCALPFTVVMIAMMVSLVKGLRKDASLNESSKRRVDHMQPAKTVAKLNK